jgi:hypothetical protein
MGSGITCRINIGNVNTASRAFLRWVDCTLLGTTTGGAGILRSSGGAAFEWKGGGIESGTAAFPYLFDMFNVRPLAVHAANLDFTAASDTLQLVSPASTNKSTVRVRLENIAMPTSWVGEVADTGNPGSNILAVNVGATNTNYQFKHVEFMGSTTHETGIYLTGGASNGGVTPISWKMSSSADAKWLTAEYLGPEIAVPCETTGSKTLTIEVLTDNVTLTNRDFGVEISYLGSTSSSAGSLARTIDENYTGSPVALVSSSATWTGTTGFTNAVKQKISVPITVEKAGPVIIRLILSRASTTVYVDPEPVIT